MTAFAPDVPAIPRPARDELLARFTPAALRRMPPTAKVWSLAKLVVYAAATAGLYPFWPLRTRVRQTLAYQAHHVELATEWLAARLPDDDADILRRAAAAVVATGRPGLGGLTPLWLLGVSAVAVSGLLAVPWTAARMPPAMTDARWLGGSPWTAMLAVGVPALSVCYFWIVRAINRQVVALQQFALAFNAVHEGGVAAIDGPSLVWGLRPLPLAVGLAGAVCGPFWVLPMAIAWTAHAEASRGAVRVFRIRLAERMTALSGVEPVVTTCDVCANADCRGALPTGAAFCPRCGATKNS